MTKLILAIHAPLLVFWFIIPESPRWLFLKKRSEPAEAALKKLVGKEEFRNIDRSFFTKMEKTESRILGNEILESSHAIATSMGSMYFAPNQTKESPGLKDIISFPKMRRATAVLFG